MAALNVSFAPQYRTFGDGTRSPETGLAAIRVFQTRTACRQTSRLRTLSFAFENVEVIPERMDSKQYKRWALDSLRERAQVRGISVSGRKNEPRLLLRRSDDLSIYYQEDWWRSAFKRSGYGGSFWFEIEGAGSEIAPAIVLLINLGDFFVPIRSPESADQIDHFLDRLIQLADWCISEKFPEFQELARKSGTALSKLEPAAKLLRAFPFRDSTGAIGDAG